MHMTRSRLAGKRILLPLRGRYNPRRKPGWEKDSCARRLAIPEERANCHQETCFGFTVRNVMGCIRRCPLLGCRRMFVSGDTRADPMETRATVAHPPPPDPLSWYCLRSQPKHENIAAIHLRKYTTVEVFAPRIRFQRPRLKGKAWTTEALFPGYLFARFDLQERWREIQYSHAVRGILRFGERYPVVPTAVIEMLREPLGPEELATVKSSMDAGQQVVVAEGAFLGLETVITHYMPAKDRVKVLMNLMGRVMEVEMPVSSVLPARPMPPRTLR